MTFVCAGTDIKWHDKTETRNRAINTETLDYTMMSLHSLELRIGFSLVN